MFIFLFVVSCLVFISTITWLSYQLGKPTGHNEVICASIGFLLSFIPPFALGYIIYLAFIDEA